MGLAGRYCRWYTSSLRPPSPPPPAPPLPPLIIATTCTTSTSPWSSSIRNDEDSADLTKSFQELSRRLPVLVNSGHRLRSFSLLNRAGIPLLDYFEILIILFLLLLLLLFFLLPRLKCALYFYFFLFLFVCRFDHHECENALTRRYVHGGDTRRRHVFRNALRLVPSTFQSCRECSVSRQLIIVLQKLNFRTDVLKN